MATDPLTSAILGLDRLVAESAAFQARVEAADDTQAREKIDLFEYDESPAVLGAHRPFAAIWPKQTTWRSVVGGVCNEFDTSGTLVLLLTDKNRHPGDKPANRRASALDFSEWIGTVIQEICEHAAEDDQLDFHVVSLGEEGGPHRTPKADEPGGSAWWAQFEVHWGLRGE